MQISLLFTFIAVLAALVGASISFADEPNLAAPIVPTSSENEEAAESPANIEPEPTNLEIAEELPHEELNREEAGELLEGVFEPEVAGAAGIYSDLHVEKFLAPNVVVIAAGRQPEVVDGSSTDGALEVGGSTGTTLMESTEPLATEGDSGKLEALDLNLERAEGSLAPANSLVEVTVPSELGEGIELPGPGIEIEAEGVDESRGASTLDDSVAFYPNVSEETDLAVAPTLGGVETMMQLRSPESPNTETYKLILPPGSSLTKQGPGAIVTKGEETLMTVAPPTALDAEGTSVPVELSVEGDRLTIRVTPAATAVYPILVDPLFQSFEWYARHNAHLAEGWGEGWEEEPESENVTGNSYYGEAVASTITGGSMSAFLPSGSYGLDTGTYGHASPGEADYWIYHVPRYEHDKYERGGAVPETFISRMTTSDVAWRAESNALSPYMVMGLWGPSKGWASLYTHEGLSGHSINNLPFVYPFPNELNVPDVKFALVGLLSNETISVGNDELFVGAATIELSEPAASAPEFVELSGPSGWLNTAKASLNIQAKDAGLGLYAVSASSEAQGAPATPWKTSGWCTGVALSPCPFQSKVFLGIEPERLPTGIDKLNVTAEDPIGRLSPVSHVEVAVDHTAPEVSLSGSVTEQATLGTKRGSYSVKVQDADGTAAKPQSGVAKVFIEVDGTVIKEAEPGCPVENCSVPLEGTIESQKYGAGEHTLKVRVVDAAGNPAPVERKFVLTPSPPSLTLSGSMTEQGVLGVSRPRYRLVLHSSAEAGIATAPPAPTFGASFGSAGTGNGQFSRPIALARDAKGNLWVVDEGHSRVEEFGPTGTYLSQFGTEGTGQGQLKKPTAIAVGPEGNLWVADTGNHRVEEFNPQGQYVSSFGSTGSGPGQFTRPDGIALDSKGDIWVADGSSSSGRGQLEEFGPTGTYLRTVTGTKTGPGRMLEPVGIAVGPEGNLWVADPWSDKVEEFEPNGTFVRWFGEYGSANGDFTLTGSIAVDAHGDIWVGDSEGSRFEEFDSEGHYLSKFGSKGTGEGQLNLGYGSAITAGPTGRLWVADTSNNRVEEWATAPPAPTFAASFGSAGTGNGQFSRPIALARDAKGNLWVVDEGHSRVEEFGPTGTYLSQFGTEGTGQGQLKKPKAIAVGPEGDLWVVDTGNHRVEQFNPQGQYVSSFGSSGSGNGQFSQPEGIAIDPKGDIWVADRTGKRLEEFGPTGTFLQAVTGPAKGAGRLWEPVGIALGPEGNLWVGDPGVDKVDEFEPNGTFVTSFGESGLANGDFSLSGSLAVDAHGDIWVGDDTGERYEEFNSEGRYLAQFGSTGSGEGQLYHLVYGSAIVAGPTGRLWVADTMNNRVEEWLPSETGSEAVTQITMDGEPVYSTSSSCGGEHCRSAGEWILNSSAVSPGSHTVKATVEDGLGNLATKTLPIQIQRDTTGPALEVGGELANAPEGWVQQETYGVHANATDGGYGVTSLVFKIDGNTVASETAACPEGGCGLSIAVQANMAEYSGGAHKAEVVATDGAGNRNVKSWTINVDPEGHISTQEETETLEAVEATSEQAPIAPTDELLPTDQREGGDNPGLKVAGSAISSTGVPDVTTIMANPEDGVSIKSPEGTTTISPVVAGTSTGVSVANGIAGVAADVGKEVDQVIRPEYNGVQIAQEIRSEDSPETFTWRVHLAARQELIQANPTQAEVVYNDGTESFLITAEPAHDATGKPVPTSLSVHGDELTVKVEFHGGSFVYPIVAGEGWETSYASPVMVEGPEDETQIREREEREQLEREEQERIASEGGSPEGPVPPPPAAPLSRAQAESLTEFRRTPLAEVAPPPEPPPGAAVASSLRTFTVKENYTCQADHCAIWKVYLRNPSYERGSNWVRWEAGTQVHCGWSQNPLYSLTPVVHEDGCGFTGPSKPYKEEDKHLTIYGRWDVSAFAITDLVQEVFTKYPALQIWVWPNGWQQPIVTSWDPGVQE